MNEWKIFYHQFRYTRSILELNDAKSLLIELANLVWLSVITTVTHHRSVITGKKRKENTVLGVLEGNQKCEEELPPITIFFSLSRTWEVIEMRSFPFQIMSAGKDSYVKCVCFLGNRTRHYSTATSVVELEKSLKNSSAFLIQRKSIEENNHRTIQSFSQESPIPSGNRSIYNPIEGNMSLSWRLNIQRT